MPPAARIAIARHEPARPTTTDSGLFSACATPASSEPSAVSFSLWCSASRCSSIFGRAAFSSEISRKRVPGTSASGANENGQGP